VHLHCCLGDAHITRNLLISTALCDLDHDPALAERQHFESCPERTQSFVLLAPEAVASEPEIYCVEKVLVTERLREELDGAALHRLDGHRNVPMPSDEYDRKPGVFRREIALKIQPAPTRQSHIEDQASWTIGRLDCAIVGDRRKQLGSQSDGSQQPSKRGAKFGVVVDDHDA
jgi:hypothetical protein